MVPLAVETFGRWGPASLRFVRQLARDTIEDHPQLQKGGDWAGSTLIGRWMSRLSIALQTANVANLDGSGRGTSGGPSVTSAARSWPPDVLADVVHQRVV